MPGQPVQKFAHQPSGTYVLTTNVEPAENWIFLPNDGNLWVGYEYQILEAQTIFIWHQGGKTTPVPTGFNTFPVNAGDALVYQLKDPCDTSVSFRLGWTYV